MLRHDTASAPPLHIAWAAFLCHTTPRRDDDYEFSMIMRSALVPAFSRFDARRAARQTRCNYRCPARAYDGAQFYRSACGQEELEGRGLSSQKAFYFTPKAPMPLLCWLFDDCCRTCADIAPDLRSAAA